MIKTQYVTSDNKVFTGPYGEQNAKDHEECIPLIKGAKDLLVGYFSNQAEVSLDQLAADLIETDLAFQITLLLRKAKIL